MNKIDHIVFSVPELSRGVENFYQLTGCEPTYGGKHLDRGTENYLVKIGPKTYFEIISKDLENKDFKDGPRWMSVDMIQEAMITRWALKSNQIDYDASLLQKLDKRYGNLCNGSRQKLDGSFLRWKLTEPGSHLLVDTVPFLLDWQGSNHPCDDLPEDCTIKELKLYDPKPKQLVNLLESLDFSGKVISSKMKRIEVTLETPKGYFTLH